MNKNIILVGILAALLCGCSENERLRIVAQDGNADAAFELSQRYAEGRNGLPKSPEKGLEWLRVAADNGNATAQVIIGKLICPLDGIFDQIRDIEKMEDARAWFEKAARQGCLEGGQLLYLMDLALFAKNLERDDFKRAREIQKDAGYWGKWCWETASDAGDQTVAEWAATAMADKCIAWGEDSKSEEFLWRTRAAETGSAKAQFKLAQMYFKGRGCEKSTEKALSWLEKAAAQGHAKARRAMDSLQNLGYSNDVEPDSVRNVELICSAAGQSFADMEYRLGKAYLKGQDVPKSIPTAVGWWSRAADLGHEAAALDLNVVELILSNIFDR